MTTSSALTARDTGSCSPWGPAPAGGGASLPPSAPAEGVGFDPRALSASSMKVDPVEFDSFHKAGATDRQLSEHFGVCKSTVAYWRESLSLPVNRTSGWRWSKPHPSRVLDPDIAITLRALGLSYRAIGEMCGVSEVAAFKCIRRHAQ